LRTYPLLQHPEELLALIGSEDALILQEMLSDQLQHGLLLNSNFVEVGSYGRSVRRVDRYRVDEADVQIDYSVPDVVDGADESIAAGHHASLLIRVKAHFLVRKRRTSGEDLIAIRPYERHIEADRKDDAECSDGAFHRAVSR
jgi:hypothetical protein